MSFHKLDVARFGRNIRITVRGTRDAIERSRSRGASSNGRTRRNDDAASVIERKSGEAVLSSPCDNDKQGLQLMEGGDRC